MNRPGYAEFFHEPFRRPLRYLTISAVVAAGGCVHSPPRSYEFNPLVIHRGAEVFYSIAVSPAGGVTSSVYKYNNTAGSATGCNAAGAAGDAKAQVADAQLAIYYPASGTQGQQEQIACQMKAYQVTASGPPASSFWLLTSTIPPANNRCRYEVVYDDNSVDIDTGSEACPP